MSDDGEIEEDVRWRLHSDVQVSAEDIDVAVNNGVVTMSGSASSAAERTRAYADAWIEGVVDVNHSDLTVQEASEAETAENLVSTMTDEEIQRAVKGRFRNDPRVKSFNPIVDVDEGTVTLSGVVEDLTARHAAEREAAETMGVWRVINHLQVQPTHTYSDEEIAANVEQAMERNPYTAPYDIQVSVQNKKVSLYGQTDTVYEKARAEYVARGVKGVIAVDNYLTPRRTWEHKSDWAINEDTRNHLRWSSAVDEENITVSVDDGVVTLTGDVGTWYQRSVARKMAKEASARRIVNKLDVHYGPEYYML